MGVVLAMHQIDMIMEPEEYLFFAGRPQALALYELFRRQLLAEVGQVQIKVQKTQITFAGRYGFAFVSHPRRKKDVGILVSFGLSHRLDSDRILHVSEPYQSLDPPYIDRAASGDGSGTAGLDQGGKLVCK